MKKNESEEKFQEKTYKGSILSDLINLSIIWVRVADNSFSKRKWNMKEHYHAFFELHYVLEGNAGFQVDNESFVLDKGNYLLIPPKHPHEFQSLSYDYREFVVGFYLDFPSLHPDGQYIQSALKEMEVIKPLTAGIHSQSYIQNCLGYIGAQPYFSSAVVMNIYLFLLEMARQIAPQTEELLSDSGQLIGEVKYYITSNISEGITTEAVAAHLNISTRHLNRLVQEELQKSVSDLIMEEKMNCIRKLLSSTNMTLDQVADLAGFTNAYNMSRSFKKQEGMSPGEYRRSLRK